jgi:hypothetical protein
MAERDDVYDPTTPEANRNIHDGGGVGARDLARQEEPSEVVPEGDHGEEAPAEPIGLAHPIE